MALRHRTPVFVSLSTSGPHLSDVSAAVHTSLGFREAVSHIVCEFPYSSRRGPLIEQDSTTFAQAAAACCNLRLLEIWSSTGRPISLLADFVDGESCKWLHMQKLDVFYHAYPGLEVPEQLMQTLLHAMPNLEELRHPKGLIGGDVAEAFPNLRRVAHNRDSDIVVVALTGAHAQCITELFLDDPSQGPRKIFSAADGVMYEDVFQTRVCDALWSANLSRLRLLEIKAWGNGNGVRSVIEHVIETCQTLTTLRLPAQELLGIPRLIRVLSRTARGLKVLRLDGTHRPYNEDIVPPHVLMTLNGGWNHGGMRGLRRLEFCVDLRPRDLPLDENPSVTSLRKFCHERRISHVLLKKQ